MTILLSQIGPTSASYAYFHASNIVYITIFADPDLKLYFKQDRDNLVIHWKCTNTTEHSQSSSFVRTFFEPDGLEFIIEYNKSGDEIPVQRRGPSSSSYFVIARKDLILDRKYSFRIALQNRAGRSLFTKKKDVYPITFFRK